jgi:lysine 2,3-aminomutase
MNERVSVSQSLVDFYSNHFENSNEENWSDWKWQIQNSFTNISDLKKIINLNKNIKNAEGVNDNLPLRITPYYASLLNNSEAIRKSVIPSLDEMKTSECEDSDPLHEDSFNPVPNIIHRYPDRVLFLATNFCSTYCRYCTRSRIVAKDKCHISVKAWKPAIEYITNHEEIRDVLISGGDPLTMDDSLIDSLLNELRNIKHVEIIRIGTKVPAVMPQRITKSLIDILKKYHPLYLSLHFTHPDELTEETAEACNRLADAGIPLGSQTVLLKDINDNIETMSTLMKGLLKIRVRPYYLYKCDRTLGNNHFQVSIKKGLEIMENLIGHTSGYAAPQFVLDSPEGKIRLLPENIIKKEKTYIITSYNKKIFTYKDD